MRCSILLLLVIPFTAEAQRSSFNLAFGSPYGSAVNSFGITAQAEAFTGEKTALFGQYNLYAPSSESFITPTSTGSVTTNWNELNFNFEYFFVILLHLRCIFLPKGFNCCKKITNLFSNP